MGYIRARLASFSFRFHCSRLSASPSGAVTMRPGTREPAARWQQHRRRRGRKRRNGATGGTGGIGGGGARAVSVVARAVSAAERAGLAAAGGKGGVGGGTGGAGGGGRAERAARAAWAVEPAASWAPVAWRRNGRRGWRQRAAVGTGGVGGGTGGVVAVPAASAAEWAVWVGAPAARRFRCQSWRLAPTRPPSTTPTKHVLAANAPFGILNQDATTAGAQADVVACTNVTGTATLFMGHKGNTAFLQVGTAIATVVAGSRR